MGSHGHPGQQLGILKLDSKLDIGTDKMLLHFSGVGFFASLTAIVSDEDAEYYTVGESYAFDATTP